MDEDEAMDALEDLWREGKVEHVPGVGDVDEHNFKLTDDGTAAAQELLREDDSAVLQIVAFHLSSVDRPGDTSNVIRALIDLAEWLRDDLEVNLWRVLRRTSEEHNIGVNDLPEEFVERFDSGGRDE
jgi:hypothetical protein